MKSIAKLVTLKNALRLIAMLFVLQIHSWIVKQHYRDWQAQHSEAEEKALIRGGVYGYAVALEDILAEEEYSYNKNSDQ